MRLGISRFFGGLAIATLLATATACRQEQATEPAGSQEAKNDVERDLAAGAVEMHALAQRLKAVPGTPLSDYALDVLLAAEDPPPVDATTAALLLESRRTLTAEQQADAVRRLSAEAGNNAYFALVLLTYAESPAKDPTLAAQALDAGASAPVYRSPFVALVDQLAARTPSDLGNPDRPPTERALGVADFFATNAVGPVVGLFTACRDAAADRHEKCVRMATTIHDGAASFIEALEAATLLDRLDPASAGRHEAALRGLRSRALALQRDPQLFTDAVSARYFATWRREGDLAAWRELLASAGPTVLATPAPDP